ncbi:MAG: hypothetical protein QOJ34_1759, partial [Pseudonocardiales bacterium]|nr:hypothetical protein [Pseudonocardiales bacterium]
GQAQELSWSISILADMSEPEQECLPTSLAAIRSGRSRATFLVLVKRYGLQPIGSAGRELLWRVAEVDALPPSRKEVAAAEVLEPAPPVVGRRRCGNCGQSVLASEFSRDDRSATAVCRDCRRARNRAYQRKHRAENPDSVRRRNLWRLYRLTPEEYDALRRSQDFKCGICRIHEAAIDVTRLGGRKRADGSTSTINRLHVDHCHVTGRIRGLLCPDCNRGLAGFQDDVRRLRSACSYLQVNGI